MASLTSVGNTFGCLYFIFWLLYATSYVWNAVLFIKLLAAGNAATNHLIVHAVGLFGFSPITVWF